MNTGIEKIAALKSCSVHYRQMGSGAPMVLLHPSSGVRLTRAVQALAERFTVYQTTCPGFDGTPLPNGEPGVPQLASWMVEFIQATVNGPAVVAGHSFGGWVASWLAVKRPDLVSHLVLQCPLGFGPLAAHPPGATPEQVLARTYTHPEKRIPETRPDEMLAQNRALAARYGKGISEDEALRKHIVSLDPSILVLYGRNDGVIQQSGLDWLVRSAKSARLEIVDDAAHHIESDQPERYVELVTRFASAIPQGAI